MVRWGQCWEARLLRQLDVEGVAITRVSLMMWDWRLHGVGRFVLYVDTLNSNTGCSGWLRGWQITAQGKHDEVSKERKGSRMERSGWAQVMVRRLNKQMGQVNRSSLSGGGAEVESGVAGAPWEAGKATGLGRGRGGPAEPPPGFLRPHSSSLSSHQSVAVQPSPSVAELLREGAMETSCLPTPLWQGGALLGKSLGRVLFISQGEG